MSGRAAHGQAGCPDGPGGPGGARRSARPPRRWTSWPVTLLATLALLLGACAEPDPDEELADAIDRTLEESVAYALTLEGGPGGEIGMLLGGMVIDGVRDEGAWSMRMSVMGFDVFELRSVDGERRHFRLGLGDALALMGGGQVDPSEPIVRELRARGVGDEVIGIVAEGFRGGWLTVEGPIGAAELDRALGTDARDDALDRGALVEILGGDIRGFVAEFVSVSEVRDSGNDRVFEIEIHAQELARALAALGPTVADEPDPDDLPGRIPGTVTVRDELVREVLLDIGAAAEETATLRIHLELSQHGDAEPVGSPDAATRVPSETFLDALRELAELFEELDTPVPSP